MGRLNARFLVSNKLSTQYCNELAAHFVIYLVILGVQKKKDLTIGVK